MNALLRLVLLGLATVLLVASCGQKGPLTLPEDESRVSEAAAADPLPLRLAQGGPARGGSFPLV